MNFWGFLSDFVSYPLYRDYPDNLFSWHSNKAFFINSINTKRSYIRSNPLPVLHYKFLWFMTHSYLNFKIATFELSVLPRKMRIQSMETTYNYFVFYQINRMVYENSLFNIIIFHNIWPQLRGHMHTSLLVQVNRMTSKVRSALEGK